jgi:L-2,4-diaminobutyrate transaminase
MSAGTGNSVANEQLASWDRESFFHPSTHMAMHARGDSPQRIIVGGDGVYVTDIAGRKSLDGFAGL